MSSLVTQLIKESVCNVGDLGLIPGLGRSPGEGNGYSLLYSGLENSMDCIVYGVAESWTRLSYFHFYIRCQGFQIFAPYECFLFLSKFNGLRKHIRVSKPHVSLEVPI